MSRLITVFVVFKIVVRSGPSELGEVLLVVELQEVGPFSTEPQEGRWQAARQGHEPLGAADMRDTANAGQTQHATVRPLQEQPRVGGLKKKKTHSNL